MTANTTVTATFVQACAPAHRSSAKGVGPLGFPRLAQGQAQRGTATGLLGPCPADQVVFGPGQSIRPSAGG